MKKGAKKIYKALKHALKDEKLLKSSRVVKTGCMGSCKNAPVAFIGGRWRADVKIEDVNRLVHEIKKAPTEFG